MSTSECYLFKNSFEFLPISEIEMVPPKVRGIYVLYKAKVKNRMDVVYVGMARGEKTGVKARLKSHEKNKVKLWTHFSVYEVWNNISKEQVQEFVVTP